MERSAVVRFPTPKSLKSAQIVTELKAVSGYDTLALATVKKWSTFFREGRTYLFRNPRYGPLLIHHDPVHLHSIVRKVIVVSSA
jgi:hypothetical protein